MIRFALLSTLVSTLLLTSVAHAHPSDHEQSLRSMLDLNIDRKRVDEVVLALPATRLSVDKDRSQLSWRIKDDIYVYEITGPQHELRAMTMLTWASENRLLTAVVDVQPHRTEAFARFFKVHALQWNIPKSD